MLAPSQELELGAEARGGPGEWGGEQGQKGEGGGSSVPTQVHPHTLWSLKPPRTGVYPLGFIP